MLDGASKWMRTLELLLTAMSTQKFKLLIIVDLFYRYWSSFPCRQESKQQSIDQPPVIHLYSVVQTA